jgi:hypothetical protein
LTGDAVFIDGTNRINIALWTIQGQRVAQATPLPRVAPLFSECKRLCFVARDSLVDKARKDILEPSILYQFPSLP